MKKFTKSLSILLAVVMLLLVAQPALASTRKNVYTVKDLAAGTAVSGKQGVSSYNSETGVWTYKYKIFKITVPKNGYITITDYNAETKSSWVYVYKTLADAKAETNKIDYVTKKTKSVPLEAGTYYLRGDLTFKFKYTFKAAAIDTTNFCKAKATTLAKGKTATVCAPDGYAYYRWYKIKLTTKQVLNVTFKDLNTNSKTISDYPDMTLYNSKGETISLNHGDGSVYSTTKTLAKGTYYIRVNSYYPDQLHLYTLMWK